jgi:hypothetical protein
MVGESRESVVTKLRAQLPEFYASEIAVLKPQSLEALLAVVEAAQEEEDAFSTRQRVKARKRKLQALAALTSEQKPGVER